MDFSTFGLAVENEDQTFGGCNKINMNGEVSYQYKYFTDKQKEFALKPDNFFTGENKCTRCCKYSPKVCHCNWPRWSTRIINDIFNKEILKRKLSVSENVLGECSYIQRRNQLRCTELRQTRRGNS
jgi:hypothetical protein